MDPGSLDPHFGPAPWTTYLDQVHGRHVMDRLHGHFLFKKELKVEMMNKHYGQLQPTKLVQKNKV